LTNCALSKLTSLQGTIDLNPGATKNRDARVIKMTQEVRAIISMCNRREETRRSRLHS
jgi:hypothetical protein